MRSIVAHIPSCMQHGLQTFSVSQLDNTSEKLEKLTQSHAKTLHQLEISKFFLGVSSFFAVCVL